MKDKAHLLLISIILIGAAYLVGVKSVEAVYRTGNACKLYTGHGTYICQWVGGGTRRNCHLCPLNRYNQRMHCRGSNGNAYCY